MIGVMTDRGLPIADRAPACPFVAFEDDRDRRALAPDHRHRCFAEPNPAPRALAHQEAYCLSSAFPVCPTFQDWARREAAAARPAVDEDLDDAEEPPVSRPMPPRERDTRYSADTDTPPPIGAGRNPHRDWAAPPPWAGDDGQGGEAAPPEFLVTRSPERQDDSWGSASRGLAGSAADRLAGPDPDAVLPLPRVSRPAAGMPPLPAPAPDDLDDEMTPPRRQTAWTADRAALPSNRPDRPGRPRHQPVEEPEDLFGPAWERPQRYEAYPSLRTRMGLPGLPGFSRLGMAVAALLLAGVVLFFVGPMLLGLGGKAPDTGAGASPKASATASATPISTAVPAATPIAYVVVKNDTMSKIAAKFGVTVDQIMAANPKIKNPDKIAIGDSITIPASTPSALPDQVSGSTIPAGSTAP